MPSRSSCLQLCLLSEITMIPSIGSSFESDHIQNTCKIDKPSGSYTRSYGILHLTLTVWQKNCILIDFLQGYSKIELLCGD